MTEQYVNPWATSLNGAIISTDTTITVNDTPPSGLTPNFRVRIEDEFLLVTAISGAGNRTWTVTRECEEATRFPKAAHANGVQVTHILSAAGLLQAIATSTISQMYLGYNAIGGSTENMTNLRVYLKKITLSVPGIITSIGAYIGQTTDHVFGLSAVLLEDNVGVPGKLLFYNVSNTDSLVMETGAGPTYTPNWVHVACGVYLPAGSYWIGVMGEINAGTQQIYYDGSGSDHYYTSGGYWIAEGGRYPDNTTTNNYSIRASIIITDQTVTRLPGRILAQSVDTGGNRSITSATIDDIPTTPIQVTLTAPASGTIDILLEATAGAGTTQNAFQSWGIREGGSIISGSVGESIAVRQAVATTEQFYGVIKRFHITGLTPGSTHTYGWGAACSTSGGTLKASATSPAIMTALEGL